MAIACDEWRPGIRQIRVLQPPTDAPGRGRRRACRPGDEQAILLDRVRTKREVTRGCRCFDADPCLDRSPASSSTAMSAIGVPQICDASAVRSSNTWSGSVSWTGCCRRTASGAVSRQPVSPTRTDAAGIQRRRRAVAVRSRVMRHVHVPVRAGQQVRGQPQTTETADPAVPDVRSCGESFTRCRGTSMDVLIDHDPRAPPAVFVWPCRPLPSRSTRGSWAQTPPRHRPTPIADPRPFRRDTSRADDHAARPDIVLPAARGREPAPGAIVKDGLPPCPGSP